MAEWFESWFDTEYYHILYKNRDEEEAERFVSNIAANLNLPKNSFILDLCCGKGRHAYFLNQLGYAVLGADLSDKSIASAKSSENNTLQFLVHDMRLPLEGKEFDAVLNLFTSFGYFENKSDNLNVLKSIASYLKSDGIFLIDFINVKTAVANFPLEETIQEGGIVFKINKSVQNNFIIKRIKFRDKGQDFLFEEKVQALNLNDFRSMLKEAGFEVLDVFGDYDLKPFEESYSERLIIKSRRTA